MSVDSKGFPNETGQAEQAETADENAPSALLDHRLSRRSFLSHAGAAGVVATASPLLAAASPSAETAAHDGEEGHRSLAVSLNVNREDHHLELDPRTTLLDCLRENLNLPGTNRLGLAIEALEAYAKTRRADVRRLLTVAIDTFLRMNEGEQRAATDRYLLNEPRWITEEFNDYLKELAAERMKRTTLCVAGRVWTINGLDCLAEDIEDVDCDQIGEGFDPESRTITVLMENNPVESLAEDICKAVNWSRRDAKGLTPPGPRKETRRAAREAARAAGRFLR